MIKIYFRYFLALLLFGSNGIVASYISLNSYEIVLLRTLIGSLFLIIVFISSRQKITFHKYKRNSFCLLVSGMAMGTSWMFLYEAYQQIGISVSSLAYYCGPVIVMVLSPLFFREKLTWIKIVGFITVLCGIFLVNAQAISNGKLEIGLFYAGMSAIMYAVMVIFNKKANRIVGLENAMIQLFISFITVALFVGIKQGYYIKVTGDNWIPIIILGLLNTGTGCYLYFSSINKLPVQTVAVCGYLEPLSAVIFSVLFLSEILLPVQILGAVLVICGAAFVELFSYRKTL